MSNIEIAGYCKITGQTHKVVVPAKGYIDWHLNGVLIQDALPELSAEDREFLISGISPAGWAQMFGEEVESD